MEWKKDNPLASWNKDQKGLPTATAGTFVSDKGRVWQAGTVVATVAKGLVRGWCHSVAAHVFKGRYKIFGGETPGITVPS